MVQLSFFFALVLFASSALSLTIPVIQNLAERTFPSAGGPHVRLQGPGGPRTQPPKTKVFYVPPPRPKGITKPPRRIFTRPAEIPHGPMRSYKMRLAPPHEPHHTKPRILPTIPRKTSSGSSRKHKSVESFRSQEQHNSRKHRGSVEIFRIQEQHEEAKSWDGKGKGKGKADHE